MELTLRNATLADIPFLVETIIEAEKSGTDVLSYTTIFGLEENEAKKYIALMLEEEIEGCELSINSFLLAEFEGKTLGAVSAWVEGIDGVSSSTLKGNLLRFTLPQKCFESLVKLTPLIKELHIDYITNTIQIGLVYISEDARGKGLVQRLLLEKIQQLKNIIKQDQEVYVQVFGNNTPAIKAYEKVGFQTVATKTTENLDILNYLPSANKILMKFNP